ncbi:hypothetical protein C7212DRAFT_340059 [Tuber magnatum]|uniref:Uncharacterized protein n=1 Tax=Tuber magnatum TaxID=42249 RepID=A0A317SZ40_9PEZI|nr:hypothetical protein C7212DRAFT_340059 [Tuber magnatum]
MGRPVLQPLHPNINPKITTTGRPASQPKYPPTSTRTIKLSPPSIQFPEDPISVNPHSKLPKPFLPTIFGFPLVLRCRRHRLVPAWAPRAIHPNQPPNIPHPPQRKGDLISQGALVPTVPKCGPKNLCPPRFTHIVFLKVEVELVLSIEAAQLTTTGTTGVDIVVVHRERTGDIHARNRRLMAVVCALRELASWGRVRNVHVALDYSPVLMLLDSMCAEGGSAGLWDVFARCPMRLNPSLLDGSPAATTASMGMNGSLDWPSRLYITSPSRIAGKVSALVRPNPMNHNPC